MSKTNYSSKTLEILKKHNNDTPVSVIDIAHELGLKIFNTDSLSKNQSGLIRKEDDGFVIYVNKNHVPVRKRFTIAHEIAHFLEHKDKIGDDYVTSNRQSLKREDDQQLTKRGEEREIEANKLAAKILMPEKKFIEIWEKSDNIEMVANIFEVSVSAATIRGSKLLNQMII
ncbi:MAG: ImmA/IrrE family metallo-endopeptidase [Patescibacteria group bacterium]|nr:ImmA/IrrE family metallo-endopeptidase [Patescibacteria group bacterium]